MDYTQTLTVAGTEPPVSRNMHHLQSGFALDGQSYRPGWATTITLTKPGISGVKITTPVFIHVQSLKSHVTFFLNFLLFGAMHTVHMVVSPFGVGRATSMASSWMKNTAEQGGLLLDH